MGKHDKQCSHDAEACYPPGGAGAGGMYPYMMESPQIRWAFIRKVYVIVLLQLMLTVAVAATVNLVGAIGAFFRSRTLAALVALICIAISPIIGTSSGDLINSRRVARDKYIYIYIYIYILFCYSAPGCILYRECTHPCCN
jgi:membrane protease YdiL (CAAX protease family)